MKVCLSILFIFIDTTVNHTLTDHPNLCCQNPLFGVDQKHLFFKGGAKMGSFIDTEIFSLVHLELVYESNFVVTWWYMRKNGKTNFLPE